MKFLEILIVKEYKLLYLYSDIKCLGGGFLSNLFRISWIPIFYLFLYIFKVQTVWDLDKKCRFQIVDQGCKHKELMSSPISTKEAYGRTKTYIVFKFFSKRIFF